MNFSAPFIHRPIATVLLAIGLALSGTIAFNVLPVSSLPEVDFPTVSVQAALPGASAKTMATLIATPLERQLGEIAGVTQMTSSSSLGNTRIILQFDLSRDINGAARDVQAAINAASSNLPSNLPSLPTYRKVNPADAPIMILALTSKVYDRGQLYDAASTILQQKISQIDGIGQVIVGGSSLPSVRVELNPTALLHYNIGLTDVSQTLSAANKNLPKGQIIDGDTISEIITNDQLFKAADYDPLIIKYIDNSPIRIRDVANVVDSVQDVRNAGLANGEPAVLLILFKQPGANVINTIDKIYQMLPLLKASVPSAIDVTVMMDRAATIRTSLYDVEATLCIAMLLVILVTYLFLGSVRAMLVPAVAVPLSLLGTFSVMQLLGYTLDNLSLTALTIATGFVVDDAVVVLENISRHLEKGLRPLQAALIGAKEVGFTVVSMSISLVGVFIPILFMGGIVGRLFREFSITLAIAILVSLVVSLTVTPMMCSKILSIQSHKEKNHLRFLHYLRAKYEKSLLWTLHNPHLILGLTIATLILTIALFVVVPKGFFPQQDTGRIMGSLQSEQNISFQALEKILTQYITIIEKDPAVQNVVGFVGGSNVNSGSLFIMLKPLAERKISADEVINRLRGKLAKVVGSSLYLQAAQDITIGGRQGNAQYQYTVYSDHVEDLNTWSKRIQEKLSKVPGIADLSSDVRDQGLQVFVNMDRDTAARFGITPEQIDQTLYAAFGQSQVSTLFTAMNQYPVVMEVAPRYWQHPDTLNSIYVTASSGQQVPLSAITSFSSSSTLLQINHQGLAPSATFSFNLLPNTSLGDVVTNVNAAIAEMSLPRSMRGNFQGTAQAFQASLSNQVYLILAALLAIYIVLGILYESLVHPITILSTLPSAGVGALVALLLTSTDLSIMALIGMLLLIGIVKKNAIMMVDFALQLERTENKPSVIAIFEAAVLRFRPIMMTTMAALLGALPLVIGFGLGAELRQPLGIAIVGGLLLSQILTLYSTPVVYLTLEKCGVWWQAQWSKISKFYRLQWSNNG